MTLFQKRNPIPKERLLFSRSALIKMLIPLIFQQIFSVLVGTMDSIMVAHAGEEAVSGVSLVSTLDILLILFFTALVGGGSVVVSQALGRKDRDGANEAAKQLLYIATFVATAITVIVLIIRKPLLTLLFGEVEPAVMENATSYFFFIALSFPLLAITESISACFRSSGNTLIALLVSLVINAVNVCGNAILIYGFEMGAAGAAISTAIARLIGAIILLVLILQKKYEIHITKLLHYKPQKMIVRQILHIGVPNGISDSMFQFGKLLTQTLISTMGTAVIAANAVAMTICGYQYMVGAACTVAMVTVVGRCIGAGDTDQAWYYSRTLLKFNYVALWITTAITLIILSPLISLYELSGESSAIARNLILLHSFFTCTIWSFGFKLPSAFRAASDVRVPMVISIVSMWVFRVAAAYVLAQETVSVFGLFTFPGLGMGIMGVWAAMFLDWSFRAALFLWRYLSGKWLHAQTVKNN